MSVFLAAGSLPLNEESFSANKLDIETQKKALQFALWKLEALRTWERDNLFQELKALADALDIKLKDFLAPLFIALSGSTSSLFGYGRHGTLRLRPRTRSTAGSHRSIGRRGKSYLSATRRDTLL